MDPALLAAAFALKRRRRRRPKAVIVVHLYGQSADLGPILDICNNYDVPLIEDAAEALGSRYYERMPGTLGQSGIYSFNGNKIITTSGGGMLVSHNAALINHAKKLAAQARDPLPYYQHTEIGYNYRLSNVLAGIGRGQLQVLDERVQARRRNFGFYVNALGRLPGLSFMPEAPWGRHTRWLTCLTVDPEQFGATAEDLRLALEADNIEARPVWKPMHLQPIFMPYERFGGTVAADLFARGLCLPSGSSLSEAELTRVVDVIKATYRG